MRHEFNIYPALFILTPLMQEQPIHAHVRSCGYVRQSNASGISKGWPQTFWGDCLFDESHTQLVLRYESDESVNLIQENLDEGSCGLEPRKFKGSRYAVTYIPVTN